MQGPPKKPVAMRSRPFCQQMNRQHGHAHGHAGGAAGPSVNPRGATTSQNVPPNNAGPAVESSSSGGNAGGAENTTRASATLEEVKQLCQNFLNTPSSPSGEADMARSAIESFLELCTMIEEMESIQTGRGTVAKAEDAQKEEGEIGDGQDKDGASN